MTKPYLHAFYENNHAAFIAAAILRILQAPTMMILSWLLGTVIDIITLGDLSVLWRLLRLTVLFMILWSIVNLSYYRLQARFIHKALAQYKALAFRKLSEKSISAFAQENTGRYLSILTNDVNTIEENYLNRTFDLIYEPLIFVGALGMMFWYSIPLTLAAIVLCLLPFIVTLAFGSQLTRREQAVSNQNEHFVSKLKDLLSGFAVIKSFKAETEAIKLFGEENDLTEKNKYHKRWCQGLLSSASESFGLIMQLGLFFIGAYLGIQGYITAGTVLIFVNLCNCLISPLQTIPQYLAARRAAKSLIDKLARVTGENVSRTGEAIPPVLRKGIDFRNVSFAYTPGKPVLQDISLTLEPRKKYAIVGASGSGKSTLLNLLMGAYDQYEGAITIDDRELRQIDLNSLYELTNLIGQNVFLFNDTIRRNITMFRDFPQEQVSKAIRRSGLSELISQKGEDYLCGENGSGLSGGERQRISIARCLLRGTPVLMLDEATAALDNQTAFAVTDAILQLEDLTCLVVTHRLEAALLARYDAIYVLRNGRLCETGTFDELMNRKAYFYSLYTVSNE